MIAPSALVEVQRDAVLVGTSGFFGLVAMEVSGIGLHTRTGNWAVQPLRLLAASLPILLNHPFNRGLSLPSFASFRTSWRRLFPRSGLHC